MRRLSNSEYANTVNDLFGGGLGVMLELNPEAQVLGFDNNAQGRVVSSLLAQQYFNAAEKLAAAAVMNMPALVACDPASQGEAQCVEKFLDTFGKRAWRRPLIPAERDNLKMAFMQGRTATFADGIQAVIQVMLVAPQFMYRMETGVDVPGANYLRLTSYELASRLSYLLWGSMPDDQLLAVADAGKLGTRADVLTEAKRMIADPRANRMVAEFTDEWLRLREIHVLEKQMEPYPTYNNGLRGPLYAEARTFFDQIIWKGDSKLETLLTAPYTYLNGPLATYYGVPGITGDNFQQVAMPQQQRIGFLTQAGLMGVLGVPDVSLTSLIFRGLFVRERLLCQPVSDPPPDAQSMNPPIMASTTARADSTARQAIPLCGACHGMMDKIGFGFENFNGAGLYQTTDRGVPVDAHGELTGTDIDGAFNGPVELVKKLASSPQVHECLATQFFRYGYGRQETAQDSCALDGLKTTAKSTGGSFKELLLALTQTDTFLLRSKGDQP
jgi:hypothetical protein